MVLFNNIPYKRIRLTSKVNLTKHFSEKYKHMCLTTRLYGIGEGEAHWLDQCSTYEALKEVGHH